MSDHPSDWDQGVETAAQAERDQMARPHVFVVNGSPEFLDLMRELLQDARYNVTTTNFVPRTFDQIAALPPQLLVIDLVVGQHAGWELLEQIQVEAATHEIPVLVTSTDPRLLARAERMRGRFGGKRWVAKPFDIDALLATIRDLIGAA